MPAACVCGRLVYGQGLEVGRGAWGSAHLELGEREATASADAAVVLDGRAADDGAELVDGARGDGGGLGLTSLATAKLAAGLFHRRIRFLGWKRAFSRAAASPSKVRPTTVEGELEGAELASTALQAPTL